METIKGLWSRVIALIPKSMSRTTNKNIFNNCNRSTSTYMVDHIKTHYKNGENLTEGICKTKPFFGRRETPGRTTIKK